MTSPSVSNLEFITKSELDALLVLVANVHPTGWATLCIKSLGWEVERAIFVTNKLTERANALEL